jgi:hypothetical protein
MNTPHLLFTLSPNAPVYELDSTEGAASVARAFVNFRNVHMLAFGGAGATVPSLPNLSAQNWVYFSSTSAAPPDEDGKELAQWERSSLIEVSAQILQPIDARQILLKIQMTALGPHGRVRVAAKRQVVQTCDIPEGQDYSLAVLLPAQSARDWLYVDIKHIQSDEGKASALRVSEIAGFLV